MKNILAVFSIIILIFISGCSRGNYGALLPGIWIWAGDKCDELGNCKKEIITNDNNTETYTRDGMYLSQRSRITYKVKGNTIVFSSHINSCGLTEVTIISVDNTVLLINCGNSIKKYHRKEN